LAREQVWLNILFSTFASALIYNIARDALAPFTGCSHSPQAKAAIREAQSGENHRNYGKSLSDATKAAISEAMKGNTNSVGNRTVYVYDSNNVLVQEYPTYTAAAEFLGVNKSNVSRIINTGRRNRKGFLMYSTPLT